MLGIASVDNCTKCGPGSYNTLPGQPFCPFQCPPGTFLPLEGGSSSGNCTECPEGRSRIVCVFLSKL